MEVSDATEQHFQKCNLRAFISDCYRGHSVSEYSPAQTLTSTSRELESLLKVKRSYLFFIIGEKKRGRRIQDKLITPLYPMTVSILSYSQNPTSSSKIAQLNNSWTIITNLLKLPSIPKTKDSQLSTSDEGSHSGSFHLRIQRSWNKGLGSIRFLSIVYYYYYWMLSRTRVHYHR